MIFSNDSLLKVVILILGIIGFLIARHIREHKKEGKKPLVCPMRFDCAGVVQSDYSKLLGVPIEVLGMCYYGTVSIFYFILIFIASIPPLLVSVLIGLSVAAFLFSLYLVCVQVFVLRKGCFWCFISALVSILIFICTVMAYGFDQVVLNFLK